MGNRLNFHKKKYPKLSKCEIEIMKNNSKLSVQEIKEIHRKFWDDFPSGKMNKTGFVKYYEQIKDQSDKTSALCDHVFALFDRDHNGTIDFKEFLLAITTQSPTDIDGQLEYVFKMCDVSGDGFMDIDELSNFLSASLELLGKNRDAVIIDPKKLAENVFEKFGVSHNHELSNEQFINGCKTDSYLRSLFGGGK